MADAAQERRSSDTVGLREHAVQRPTRRLREGAYALLDREQPRPVAKPVASQDGALRPDRAAVAAAPARGRRPVRRVSCAPAGTGPGIPTAGVADIYAGVVERTTIYLDADLKRRLKTAAARSGRSEASTIREALEQYLASEETVRLRPVGRSNDGGVADQDEPALGELGFGRS